MPDRVKLASLSMLVVLIAFTLAPIAKADGWDKETVVTFSNPVEVPGQVLSLSLIAMLCRSLRKTGSSLLQSWLSPITVSNRQKKQ